MNGFIPDDVLQTAFTGVLPTHTDVPRINARSNERVDVAVGNVMHLAKTHIYIGTLQVGL